MSSEWKRQASVWFQEHKLAVSLIGIIISCFMSYVGIISQWYSDSSLAPVLIIEFLGDYDVWVLIFGLIALSFSGYYFWLTRHYMNRFEEIISTSSKKEFQRSWTEIEQIARYQLPKAYRKRLSEVRKKFGLR